jgi:hypothetical protein
MPVKPLPSAPGLNHLRHQAKDLLRALAARQPAAAQLVREFHPRFTKASDDEIFSSRRTLANAQLVIARQSGFDSWPKLKRRVEKPAPGDDLNARIHERIADATFRRAVELLDAGDVPALTALLRSHPELAQETVEFEGGNYFRNPTLLDFVAENPVRQGKMPPNVVAIATAILEAGAKRNARTLNSTLGLVCSGRVAREAGMQPALIELLCAYGADANSALHTSVAHGEFAATSLLLTIGAQLDLPAAAALGRRPAPRARARRAIRPHRNRSHAARCGRRSQPLQSAWLPLALDSTPSGGIRGP